MDATGTWLATIFKIIIIFLKKDLIYNKSLKCAVWGAELKNRSPKLTNLVWSPEEQPQPIADLFLLILLHRSSLFSQFSFFFFIADANLLLLLCLWSFHLPFVLFWLFVSLVWFLRLFTIYLFFLVLWAWAWDIALELSNLLSLGPSPKSNLIYELDTHTYLTCAFYFIIKSIYYFFNLCPFFSILYSNF